MTSSQAQYTLMVGLILLSGTVVFGASMLARRVSPTFAAITAALAFVFVAGCGVPALASEYLDPTEMGVGVLTLALLVVAGVVQARCFSWRGWRSAMGLLSEIGIGFVWFFALWIVEMVVTADGGPGFARYGPICLATFLAAQIALPRSSRASGRSGGNSRPACPSRASTRAPNPAFRSKAGCAAGFGPAPARSRGGLRGPPS